MTIATGCRRRGLALLAIGMLAVAACSSPAEDEPGAVSTPSSTAGGDEGSVVVAVMYPDVSVAAELGLAEDFGDVESTLTAFAEEANERGGIAGRDIRLELVQFDLLVEGDDVRACLTATQDLSATVVIGLGGVFGDPVLCVAEQNETLFVGADGFPAEFYERSGGRLFSLTPSKEVTQLAILEQFEDVLAEAPFAVLSSADTGGDDEAVQRSLLPALAAADLDPAVTVVLDSDPEVAASQTPVEIEELRDAGVETVVSTAGFFATGPFAQALEAAGVDALWLGSDAAGFASDLFASQMDPAQLDGARAVTVHQLGWSEGGLDEPEAEADCRRRAADLLGTDVTVGSVDAGAAFAGCTFMDLLVEAGQAIDGEVTSSSLGDALRTLEALEIPDYGPAGFGPEDSQAADAAREVTWSADCECWSAVGDFAPLPSP